MKYQNIREEELKNKISQDYFWLYDCTKIIGNVDFCVSMYQSNPSIFEQEFLLWAEAKKGSSDIYKSIVQLILTIGKARTFDKYLPPAYLGAFDSEKIAFIPYNEIHDVFYINDFNWNVTPSNYDTKEFKLIYNKVKSIIDNKALLFYFINDDRELKKFIKNNFVVGKFGVVKTKIDKNNFIVIYNKWLQSVKPSIAVNWEIAKKNGIIDGDFYLADLLSEENITLKEKLFVLLKKDHYELDRRVDEMGMFSSKRTDFNDNQVAHTQFWNKYERPPKEEYWDYIVERRDLLVPQDVRERKGSFFTPQIWVELSQKYLSVVLGEDWQDEYYVWDCAAGTGNLLAGLTNKYNIWASTLDQQDVEVMHDRINNGANLLHDHVFQFDFLNDDFIPKSKGGKIPDNLYKIISNPEERKKLVVYINPPYAEATTAKTVTGTGKNKSGVAIQNKANQYFKSKIGSATNEVFALFMAQVYDKIQDGILAQFSKLKFVQGSNFDKFKEYFKAKYLGGFVVPANTFDNVKGEFPIGFTIWNLNKKVKIEQIICDVYDRNGEYIGKKNFYGNLPDSINKWIVNYQNSNTDFIGLLSNYPPDFQNQNKVFIQLKSIKRSGAIKIQKNNLIPICIYFAVRHCIEATWINDRDQFLYPNDGWKNDKEFQNDCLAFTLFHGQNRISSKEGVNHWIPFTEQEVNARDRFDSHFMTDFIKGKIKREEKEDLFNSKVSFSRLENIENSSELDLTKENLEDNTLKFSLEAQAVFSAGLELWKYYHSKSNVNVNASLYDIKEYFQGRNDKGKMNNKSNDDNYMQFISNLREKLKILAEKIEPKLYLYGFLKR
jgi:hypothetical protein